MAGRSHRDIWSSDWAIGGLVAGGIGLLIAVAAVIAGLARAVTGGFRDGGIAGSGGGGLGSGSKRVGEEVIAGIVSVVAGSGADEVTPDKNLVEDFAVDSSCMTEIAVPVEERFNVEIPDSRLSTSGPSGISLTLSARARDAGAAASCSG